MYAFRLAFKNVISRKSSIVIIIFIAFALSLFVLSNAVFDGTDNGIEKTYVNSFTGNIVIRPVAQFPLSLFGDETPVTGSLSAIPNLIPYSQVKEIVDNTDGIERTIPQISGAAALNIKNTWFTTALFGVNARDYIESLSSISVIEGSPYSEGEKGIMINAHTRNEIESYTKTKLNIGDSIQLIMSDGASFTIRSAVLTGIYEYSVQNDILDKICLVSPEILRSLMGMDNTVADDSQLDENSVDLLEDFDLDSLFGEETDFWGEESEASFDFESDAADSEVTNEAVPESTCWNYIVCKTAPDTNTKLIISLLNMQFKQNGWQVQAVDWRTAAGSSVYIMNYLRIILNVGLIIILLTGFIVINNTLIVQALGRMQETGTLKAIGAKKRFISLEFFAETSLLTVTAGILGCLLGIALNALLSSLNITFSNPYLIQLFGGATLKTVVTAKNLMHTMIISVLLAIFSWFYPVSVAFRTSPLVAMRGQA